MTETILPTTPEDCELADRICRPAADEIDALDAWWRANNYLTVGQIYLMDNPLLREPLTAEHIKPRLLGHWGTSPGLSFVYVHASRLIRLTGQQLLYLAGPGHGGPALVAAGYLEGSYSEIYPAVSLNESGMRRLFRQFSAPGGIPSHVSVTTPGSIHEGGELGYVLVHAFGAVLDNPDLIALAVVGDGEAETGPLEGSWKGISFLNPERDGAVLPVLHLNGAKIAGPTVLGRKDPAEVRSLLEGHGYQVFEVTGADLPGMHHRFAETLGRAWATIRAIQAAARDGDWDGARPRWPMIVLRSPEGLDRAGRGGRGAGAGHLPRPPGAAGRRPGEPGAPGSCWSSGCAPTGRRSSSTPTASPTELVRRANPAGPLRMSATPHANGGLLTRPLDLPDYRDYAVEVPAPASVRLESTRRFGRIPARRLSRQSRTGSGCSARTRPTPTGSARCSRHPTVPSPSG